MPKQKPTPRHYRSGGKKKEGTTANFISRSLALKYLQVSLSCFTKLCSLKGIIPREPKKKVKGSQIHYHMKDIMSLKHDPLLETSRERRAYARKVNKAWMRTADQAELLSSHKSHKSRYGLDDLIQERLFLDEGKGKKDCRSLFKDMKFFLSHEVPRESLLSIISAYGGLISWERRGGPFNGTDPTITHQIVGQSIHDHKSSREYVKPQWIYDCVNARAVLPTDKYTVGSLALKKSTPPSLSQVAKNEKEGYVPEGAKTTEHLQATSILKTGPDRNDMNDSQYLLVAGLISQLKISKAAEMKEKTSEVQRSLEELKLELRGASAPSSSTDEISLRDTHAENEHLPSRLDQLADITFSMENLLISCKRRKITQDKYQKTSSQSDSDLD